MSELKSDLSDDEVLMSAYRTLSNWTNESIGLMSQTIPKTPDPNQMSALQLQALVEKYDTDIKRFKDLLAGKVKPHTLMVEPPVDRQNMPKAKRTEQELQKDIGTIRQGLSILKKRRGPYAHKLFLAKINQLKLSGITSQAEQLNQEATQITAEIEEHRTKIKSAVNRYYQLQSRLNDLNTKFNNINLDPTKIGALTLSSRLPTVVQDFAKS